MAHVFWKIPQYWLQNLGSMWHDVCYQMQAFQLWKWTLQVRLNSEETYVLEFKISSYRRCGLKRRLSFDQRLAPERYLNSCVLHTLECRINVFWMHAPEHKLVVQALVTSSSRRPTLECSLNNNGMHVSECCSLTADHPSQSMGTRIKPTLPALQVNYSLSQWGSPQGY